MTNALLTMPDYVAPHEIPDFQGQGDRRILIVDDELMVRQLFFACLSRNYICLTAANAEEALKCLEKEPCALVLLDVIMPGLNGIEFLRKIVASFPDTSVIMVSGIDRTQRVLDAIRLGAFDYLIKPCDLDVLELSVGRALERRALLRSARQYKLGLERHNAELANRQAELEQLQVQMVHNEKMASLGKLAAGVAHELNNPAGFIYGNMAILSEYAAGLERLLGCYEEAQLPAEVAALAHTIKEEIGYDELIADLSSIIADCHEGAERIRDVVQNLRIFSRLDEAEFKKVDLHEGIESTVRLLSRFYSSSTITLHRDYAELPMVDCYAGQLNQVWMNLLVNAAYAVNGPGMVRIKTTLEDETVLVEISDTGSGIAPEHLNKIFDPFFTTKPVGEGTGLGLSTSFGIIKRHGGSIKVESRIGLGTTFNIAIPVHVKRRTDSDGE
jgi:two-component system NtrC family sensor kinase